MTAMHDLGHVVNKLFSDKFVNQILRLAVTKGINLMELSGQRKQKYII